MRSRLVLLPLLIALLISSSAFAQTEAPRAKAVVLIDGQDRYPLGRYMEILRDPSRELTIQEVSSPAYQDQFTLSRDDTPNFGFQKAAYWVRFQVRNQAEQNSSWVLELGFVNMHYLDLYLPSADGASYVVKQSGVLRPYENRDIPFRRLVFNLDVPPGSEQTVYLRFQNDASMTLPLILFSRDAFTGFMLLDQLRIGLYFGALIIMALYNLFLWYSIRQRSYLYLLLFIGSLLGANFLYDGIAYQFFQFSSPRVATSSLLVFLGLEIFFVLKFATELLELKTASPKLNRWSNYFGGMLILTILVSPFGSYQLIGVSQLVLGIIIFAGIAAATLYFAWTGLRPARYLLISWSLFIVSGILFAFTRLGLLSSTPFTEGFNQVGMVWMVAVWSLALADRVNTLKVEAETTNRQLKASESRLLQFLEAMPVGVVVYGTDLKPRYINEETRRLLTNPAQGVFPDDSMQRSLEETMDYFSFRVAGTEQPYPLERLPIIRAMRKGQPATAEDVEIGLGDQRIPTESWASPLFDASGEVEGAIVAFRDIREHLEQEALLQESEVRYRRLVETMNEGLGVSDEQDRFTYVNPRLAEMLGYSQDEMIGRPVAEFFNQENRAIIADQLARRREGEEQPYTVTWCRKDGCDLPTLVAPAAVFDQDGKYLRSIVVVTDISEQVRVNQMLEQRVLERTRELRTLLDVSRGVAGTLELEPLLKLILETLREVVDFSGAAIFSLTDRQLSTLNFPLLVAKERASLLAQPLVRLLSNTKRFEQDEAIIIPDVRADSSEGREFRRVVAEIFDLNSSEMRAWIVIPLKVKKKFIGVLTLYHSQPGYYTPEKVRLANAFANQTSVAIENASLYRQAQGAAATKERQRLARDLHDSVTQAVYSMTLYANATRLALQSGKDAVAKRNLNEVLAIAREGMADLRLLIFELRPPLLGKEGLVGALRSRLEVVEARAGCEADIHVEGEPNLLPDVESEIYWAVNEALNNALKHSRASHLYLDMRFENGASTITIRDNGVGFATTDLERSNGMGLKNIAERVERIGGSVKVESASGHGTVIQVKVE